MPFMRRKTIERLVAVRTGVLDERLREAERRIANGDLSVGDFERRLGRAESEASRTTVLTEAQSARLAELQTQVTTSGSQLRHDLDRRLAIFEELLSAVSQRAAEDRKQVEAALSGLEQRLTEHGIKLDRALAEVDERLDDGSFTATTRDNVSALANELARLSIELRSDVARAVNEIKLTNAPKPGPPLIDLTPSEAARNGAP
jgi:chromosome segregation ATPase